MARYRTTIDSKLSPGEAFEYLSDFAKAKEWDPGVIEGEALTIGSPGPGSRFRLVAKFLGRKVPLEYSIIAFDPAHRVVFQADEAMVRSTDEICCAPSGEGPSVTSEADLRLKGALGGIFDPLLGLVFRRIGDRASAGLEKALNA